MREGWWTEKLGDLCKIELGRTPARADPTLWDERRETCNVWLSIADLLNGTDNIVSDSKEYISTKGAAGCKVVSKGTLLVSFKLTLGRLAFAGRDLYTNEAIAALTIIDEKKLFADFLFYYLHFFDWNKAAEGEDKVKGKTLNKAKLKEMFVDFPSITEQKRIVVLLAKAFERIDAAIANSERNLANARDLFESYLNSLFLNKGYDWITEPLGTNVRFIDYRGKTPPKRDAGIRLITAKNVRMGFIQRTPEEFVDPSAYDAWMTRGFPKKGDVLFTTEAPLGNVAQLDTDETVIIGQRLITFQPKSQMLDRTFLKFALMSQSVQQEIFKRRTGATVSGIKASLLKQVPIHFPEKISEQVAMAAKIGEVSEACQRIESIYLQKVEALEELKQTILRKAFVGGLTARSVKAMQEAAE